MTMGGKSREKGAFCWKSSPLITVVLCLGMVAFAAVFLAVAAHTLINSDDYGSLIEYQVGGGLGSILQNAARLTGRAYLEHMGAYTSFFLGNALIFAFMEGWFSLPALMVVLTLLLMAAWVGFVMTAVCSAGLCRDRSERNVALLFGAASLFCVYDIQVWPEIDNWISGFNAYGLPTIFGMIAAALLCRRAAASRRWAVVATVCAFLSSGGTLQITGGICSLLLVILLIKLLQGFAKPADGIVFGAAFVGALINVAAPGNYVRRDSLDPTGFHPGIAFPFIIQWGNTVWTSLLTHAWVLALAVGIFVLGVHLHQRIRPQTWKLLLLLVACAAAPYVSAFPVCLGYGGGYFPNRCLWAATSLAALALLAGAFVLGCLAGRLLAGRGEKALPVAASAVIAVLAIAGILRLPDESAAYRTLRHLTDGTIAEYCRESEAVMDELSRQKKGEQATVTYLPPSIEEIKPFYLSPDPENEINLYVAEYFGLESVTYEPDAQ